MTDTKENPGKGRLSLSRPGGIELKKIVETGQVRQNFSHGRSKAVTVEVRKRRSLTREDLAQAKPAAGAEPAAKPATPAPEDQARRAVQRALTDEERATRLKALEDSRHVEPELKAVKTVAALHAAVAEEEAKRRAAEEEAKRQAEEEEIRRRADEEEHRKAEETRAKKAGEEMAAKLAGVESARKPAAEPEKPPAKPAARPAAVVAEDEDEVERERTKRAAAKLPRPSVPTRRDEPRRRAGRLTIAQALDSDTDRMRSLASVRRQRERAKKQAHGADESQAKVVRDVVIPESITVQDLASRMAERGAEVIKTLMRMGVMATITQSIDGDTAELVVTEFGHRVKRVSAADVEIGVKGEADTAEHLESRAPVVTVMGHVDHGKTSLLDALRKTDVAAHEAGGITQHIGAYQVRLASGQHITFLDTPGHEAFTAMRARGAKVTDIVVLVVAADDSVMPQTIEAIAHAKAANVPLVVAINKIDKPGANPNKVRTELLQHGVLLEGMGGDVLAVEVSALAGTNLGKLEESILLQAEILDLKSNPNRPAEGVVIEAKLDRGRGPVATVLVQRGTLRGGDIVVAGSEWGRVRALVDDRGRKVAEAGPAVPVEILGLSATPDAGDEFSVVASESRAREVTEFRRQRARDKRVSSGVRGTLEQMMSRIASGEGQRELAAIVKADVQGSVEALVGALEKIGTDEAKIRVVLGGVGGITESDVSLAGASKALVIGFNVRASPQAREIAKRDGVEIRYYSIIYDVIDDIKKALSGLLAPSTRETIIGNAQIREVFDISKVGKVAGCMVTDGVIRRGAHVRLLRDNVVIHEGRLGSLRRFKEEVREVKDGYECGMALERYQDIRAGDIIECFEVEEVARTL
ncbi:MAG: translation initiation factor IF-2 [Alphaproteobacteria bacterium]